MRSPKGLLLIVLAILLAAGAVRLALPLKDRAGREALQAAAQPTPGAAAAGRPGPAAAPKATAARERAPAVAGLVVDSEAGNPIAGARIGLIGPVERSEEPDDAASPDRPPQLEFDSGADGRFSMEAAPGDYVLQAEAPGYPRLLRQRFTLAASKRAAYHRVELRRAADLEVLVLDQDGQPQRGATARSEADFGLWRARVEGESGEDGRVLLSVPEGRNHLVSARLGDGAELARRGIVVQTGQREIVELRFDRRVEFRGRVLDRAGGPLSGVRLSSSLEARFERFAQRAPRQSSRTQSGQDGVFALRVADGPQRLRLSLEGYTSRQVVVLPSKGSLDIVLERSARVSGRILDEATGAPLPGAVVESHDGETVRSGAGGAYSLSAGVDEFRQVRLSARSPGHQPARTTLTGVAAGEQRSGVDLRLGRAIQVRGLVLDAISGSPLAGAQVGLQSHSHRNLAVTDSTGWFEIVAPGTRATLTAEAQGYTARKASVELPEDRDTEELELRLEPIAWIEGRVLDVEGHPVVGAEIKLLDRGLPQPVSTSSGTDGAYLLEPVEGGKSYGVVAAHPNFAPAERPGMRIEPGAHLRGVDFVLARGGGVAGVVVTVKTGEGVSGVTVTAQRAGGDPFQQRLAALGLGAAKATTGPDGSFQIRPLRAGAYRVAASGPDIVSESRSVKVADDALTGSVRIEVHPGMHLRGLVTEPGGEPISGVLIHAGWLGGRSASADRARNPFSVVQSGPDGRFDIGGLEKGRYKVEAHLYRREWSESRNVEAPSDDVDFVVRATAEVGGKVVRAKEKSPVAAFEVTVQSPGEGPLGFRPETEGWPFYSPDGSFLVSGLGAGVFDLEVRAAGFAPGRVSGIRLEDGQSRRDLIVELVAGAAVSGLVLDDAGAPVSGARVAPAGSSPIPGLAEPEDRLPAALSNARGEFRLAGLAAGSLELKASRQGYRPAGVRVQLGEGEDRTGIELRLRRGFKVRGTVLAGGSKRPVPGAGIGLDIPALVLGFQPQTTSGEDGSFEIPAVAAGQHSLVVKAPDSQLTATKTLDVQGDLDNVEVELPAGGTIFGQVLAADGRPVPDVRVKAFSPAASPGQAVTDEKGGFIIGEMAPGSYSVSATVQSGGASHHLTQPAVLEEGGRVAVVLRAPSGAALFGKVSRADGGSVEGYYLAVSMRRGGLIGWIGGAQQHGTALLPASGDYRVEGLQPGTYRVQISSDFGYGRWDRAPRLDETVEISEEDVQRDFQIPPLARIQGTVTSTDGKPLPGARVGLGRTEPGDGTIPAWAQDALVQTVAEEGGIYELKELPPGTFELQAAKEGHAAQGVRVQLEAGEALQQDFVLRKGGALWGRVLDPRGQVLEGATLHIRRNGGLRVLEVRLVADEQGNYEVSGLALDHYYLTVTARGLAPATAPRPVRVGGDVTVQVDFRLGQGGNLRITVRDASGAPLAGREVQIQQLIDGVGLPITGLGIWTGDRPLNYATDARGVVEAHLLEPGSYLVRNMGEVWDEREAQVLEGQTAEVLLQLQPQ